MRAILVLSQELSLILPLCIPIKSHIRFLVVSSEWWLDLTLSRGHPPWLLRNAHGHSLSSCTRHTQQILSVEYISAPVFWFRILVLEQLFHELHQ